MHAIKLTSFLLATLVLSCHFLTPLAMHSNNDNGLAVLLAAGILAKLLRHQHKHEEHHIHIPVHHEHHGHHHHGSGSSKVLVHQPAPFHHLYGGAMAASNMYPQVMYAQQQAARYPPHAPY